MEHVVKYILLGILVVPFSALMADASGRTDGLMLRGVVGAAVVSALLAFATEGLHQRPNVANVFAWAFVAWPFFVLIAKGINPTISWKSIWISIPVMSWYLVNLSMQFYHPTDGGGGGMGAGLGLIAGWSYMIIPFAILSGFFIGIQSAIRKTRGGRDVTPSA